MVTQVSILGPVFGGIVILLVRALFVRRISRPLRGLERYVNALAAGEQHEVEWRKYPRDMAATMRKISDLASRGESTVMAVEHAVFEIGGVLRHDAVVRDAHLKDFDRTGALEPAAQKDVIRVLRKVVNGVDAGGRALIRLSEGDFAPPQQELNLLQTLQKLEAEHSKVMWDCDRVRNRRSRQPYFVEIMNELLTNAYKYSNGGNIWVDAKPDPDEDGPFVAIRVENEGQQFPVSKVERMSLLAWGSRGREAVEGGAFGSGIGLAFVHRQIMRGGGHLDLSNREDGGARVTIRLRES